MAAVFHEVKIKWRGDEISVKPTMRLLNDIEQELSLSRVAYRLASGDPPLTQLAVIIAHFLRAGGVRVTDEEVYAEIMQGSEHEIEALAHVVMVAAFPQVGKPEAPATEAKSKPRKGQTGAGRKISTGANTTKSGAASGA